MNIRYTANIMSIQVVLLFVLIFAANTVFAQPSLLLFNNFQQQIRLTPDESGWHHLIGESETRFKLTNRLIIKTIPEMDKSKLSVAIRSVEKITELYRMRDGTYYLLTIAKDRLLQEELERIGGMPFVLSIQPDLLQKQHQATLSFAGSVVGTFLSEIRAPELWLKSKGKGVRIAIIDDGFDLNHIDLKGTNVIFSYDVDTQTLTSTPKNSLDTHGTKVTGVIFARHNGEGLDGIAPEAGLIAIRSTDSWTSNLLLSFYLAKLNKADVINCSWTSEYLLEPVADVIGDLTENGRKGKGAAVVFAAGNQGVELKPRESEAGLPGVVSVGASSIRGKRMKFSNYGPLVDLYAPGMRIPTTLPGDQYGVFSGTSAAAPIVSGLIALKLSVNPDLTIKQIEGDLIDRFEKRVQ